MSINLKKFSVDDPIPECKSWHDSMPKTRAPGPFETYMRARKLWRSKKEFQLTQAETLQVLDGVQSAAADGDWGAKATLAHFYRFGLGIQDINQALAPDIAKSVAIVKDAASAGQAWGHFDLGVAYEYGYGGISQDSKIAWAHYRHAAELGSPYAQMTLAKAYGDAGHTKARDAMINCAYSQHHPEAAYSLGITADVERRYLDAVKYYQDGVRFGSKDSAAALMLFFGELRWEEHSKDRQRHLISLHLLSDPERERRYVEIMDALDVNPDLRFGEIDTAIPLPPGKLPPWTGIRGAMTMEDKGPPRY